MCVGFYLHMYESVCLFKFVESYKKRVVFHATPHDLSDLPKYGHSTLHACIYVRTHMYIWYVYVVYATQQHTQAGVCE